MAGGSGTRLWPLSRKSLPKQFLKLGGQESLLQKTAKRLRGIAVAEDIFVITSADSFHEVAQELPQIPRENIFIEPEQKNTAAAIALAMKMLIEKRGLSLDELVFVTPADHMISPEEKFWEAVKEGEKRALEGEIVTFGVFPSHPETGYGYIHAKDGKVEGFVEKPSLQKAQEYLLSGHYFWNSGMFLFSLKTMQSELQKYAPELALPSLEELLARFSALPKISIDYAVMEKSTHLAMVPLYLSWSDVGSWENVYELFEKDETQNVSYGNVMTLDTKGCLIFSQKRLIATVGVEDLMVIETGDALLVAKKGEGQKVKEVVEKLSGAGKPEAQTHLTTHRPWGLYTVLGEAERYKIKRIVVKPQEKLSLQLHYHRSEHWIVVSGTAKVTINDQEHLVHEGESIFVPKSAIHRVENPGKVILEIIEVQVGEYLGEDDIVRLEDIYGRLKEDAAFNVLLRKE